MGDILSLIDEDYGQLDALLNGEDQYPVTYPCVLISLPEIPWSDVTFRVPPGEISLTVQLGFD
jgi:hypothetical protein